MRALEVVLLLAFTAGCTSVKMVQRDGCWVRRTEKVFGRVHEEIGPCTRPQPEWAEDRFTRLVQECVAQTDYRWQGRAIEAWSRGNPYPAQPPQDEVLQTCMQEAKIALVSENDHLKGRVQELAAERSSLQRETDRNRAALQKSIDRMAEFLGEAAKKPTAPAYATATATSDGKAMNENGTSLSSRSGSGASSLPTGPAAKDPPSPGSGTAATQTSGTPNRVAPPRSPRASPRSGGAPSRACDLKCTEQEAVAAPPAPQKPH